MKLAAVDIGSNSIHMIIVQVDPSSGTFDLVDREREMVKLGAGAFASGRLGDTAIAASMETLDRMAELARRHGVAEVLAVATSAVREARNGREVAGRLQQRSGIPIRIIDGATEAALIWSGVSRAVELGQRPCTVVDIGGGSVEIITGGATRIVHAESLPLGVQRLRDRFGASDPLSRDERDQLVDHVRATAGPCMARATREGSSELLGTSGTVLALGLAAIRARGADPWSVLDGQIVSRAELEDLASQLFDADVEGRVRIPGVDERRADTLHLAAGLLLTLMDLAHAPHLRLCSATLREGLVVEWLRARGALPPAAGPRRQSVLGLLRRLGRQEDPEPDRVARLAVRLFDGTRPLHGFSAVERELCEYAAMLADVGRPIGFVGHEHLAFHLIRGGGLRGFTTREVDLMALVARYHRRGTPKPRHTHYAELGTADRHRVKVLAGLLRVAWGLERGRTGLVHDVQCDIDRHRIRFTVVAATEAALELEAARQSTELLGGALDRQVQVRLQAPAAAPSNGR